LFQLTSGTAEHLTVLLLVDVALNSDTVALSGLEKKKSNNAHCASKLLHVTFGSALTRFGSAPKDALIKHEGA